MPASFTLEIVGLQRRSARLSMSPPRDRRRWQGARVQDWLGQFKPEQRSQRRRGPARSCSNGLTPSLAYQEHDTRANAKYS